LSGLADRWVVLGPDLSAAEVAVTPTVYEELDRGFRHRLLVAMHRFDADWATWEVHPHGDEVVVLMSGAAEMVFDRGGKHESVQLSAPGDYVVVPRGTWHTARVSVPTAMLFVTPGEGTENRAP
jgi:mannose-6-phosphate isomerase-like protein (cupin superfamily)